MKFRSGRDRRFPRRFLSLRKGGRGGKRGTVESARTGRRRASNGHNEFLPLEIC